MSGSQYNFYSARSHPKNSYNAIIEAENEDLKHEQVVTDELIETLNNAQYVLDKSTGDMLKVENDYKIQVDNDAISINKLKNEGIDLKHSLADRNAEISSLRYMLDNLDSKLKNLTADFRICKEDNDYMKSVQDKFGRDVNVEIDINNALKRDLDEANPQINKVDSSVKNHHRKIDELENHNTHIISQQNQDGLNRDIEEAKSRIRDVDAQSTVHGGVIRNLTASHSKLDATLNDLNGKLTDSKVLFDRIHADLENERYRGDNLKNTHQSHVSNIETRRCEFDELSREANDLDGGIVSITELNNDLEFQSNEMSRHVNVLSKQNIDLNEELTQILMRDQQVQEELNRRRAIADKQRANDENLKKSLSDMNFKIKEPHMKK